jgi:uncharacterized protein
MSSKISEFQDDNVANDFFAMLKEKGIKVSAKQMQEITEKVEFNLSYRPKVGVLGKTGAGKSSLCNALFGKDISEVSDVAACTREPKEIFIQLSDDQGLTLLDLPGIGESRKRDEEYFQLYKSLIPELDLIIWVLKADDRAYGADQDFYNDTILELSKTHKTPVLFVLNQIDLIKPSNWNDEKSKPSEEQEEKLNEKMEDIFRIFNIKNIIPVSAEKNYGMVKLVQYMLKKLPDEKKLGFVKSVKAEHQTREVKEEASKGFWSSIVDFAKEKIGSIISTIVPSLIEKGASFLFKKIFG